MTDYPGAIWMPNNNAFPARNGVRPRYVLLHGTAGGVSAQNIATYFAQTQGTNNPVSSHYVIGQDGTVVQCVSESDGAWANGALSAGHAPFWNSVAQIDPSTGRPGINPNNLTISIEHCKPSTDNSDQLTPAQQAASFKLIHDICQRWQIPMRNADASGGITGHFSLDPVNRSECPGPYPWDALWAYLAYLSSTNNPSPQEEPVVIELSTPGVSPFLGPAANGAWRTQAGFHIGGAILSFYKHFGNSGLCGLTHLGLPLTEEVKVSAQHPEIVLQRFERGILAYDPHHILDNAPGSGDVYLIHIDGGPGQQLIAAPLLQKLQQQLQVKIDDLNQQLKQFQAQTPVNPAELATLKQQLDATTKLLTDRTARLAQIASDANKLATDANQIITIAKI